MPRTRSSRRIAGATVGLAALLLAAACGSSAATSNSSSTGSAPAASSPGSSSAGSSSEASSSAGSAATSAGSAAAPASDGSASVSSAPSSAGAGSDSSDSSGGAPSVGNLAPAKLTVLIGSSGAAETKAVTDAAAEFSKASGSTVTVSAASNLPQQLSQGFSSGSAPDLFYVGADVVGNYAKAGNLLAYGDDLPNKSDFYPSLVDTFTYDGKLQCAPKDFSTLGLWINTDIWSKAGLTDADVPKNWDELAAVAKKLTTDKVVGLALSAERDRLDSFLVQDGSYLVDDSGKATVNDQKNIDALTYVKKLYTDGSAKTPKDLGAGWAGEAFGKAEAAMTIEGNWMTGALKSDYPTIKAKAYELPTGPGGTKGTLSFTNCWGMSATTKSPDQAKAFVAFLTSKDEQLKFAADFGVIPSIQSAKDDYLKANPTLAPFVNGVEYAKGVVNAPGITDVLDDFNSQLGNLKDADPKAILDSVQTNLESALTS